jgi:hypothetical protein
MWKVQNFISNKGFLRAVAVKTEYVNGSINKNEKNKEQIMNLTDCYLR